MVEVVDQTVTWPIPYQFTQDIPADVDVRIMLTFLELHLHQTLLSFVFFKSAKRTSKLLAKDLCSRNC